MYLLFFLQFSTTIILKRKKDCLLESQMGKLSAFSRSGD